MKAKKSNEQKKSRKLSLAGDTEDEDSATTSTSLKRGKTDAKKRKMDENVSVSQLKQENFTAIKKPKRDDSKDLAICRYDLLIYKVTNSKVWYVLLKPVVPCYAYLCFGEQKPYSVMRLHPCCDGLTVDVQDFSCLLE